MTDKNKLSESDKIFVGKLAKMLKNGDIKFKDIPVRLRDFVAKEAFERYPIKRFEDLKIIIK